MSEHIAGKPVSKATYDNGKCRCDGCRAANNAWMREHRKRRGGHLPSDKAQRRAIAALVKLTIEQNPRLWRHLLDEAYREDDYRPRPRPSREEASRG